MERSQKTQEKYVRKYAKQMKKRDLLHLGYGKGVIKRSILYRGKSLLSDSKIETINTKYRKKISEEEETKKQREQNRRERKRENDRKYRERKRAEKKGRQLKHRVQIVKIIKQLKLPLAYVIQNLI